MALFNVPTRPGRETDVDIAKKLKTKPKQVATRSTGVVEQIQNIRSLVLKVFGGKEQYCKLIQTEEEIKDYVELICKNGIFAVDTETTGLDPIQDKIVGFSLYTPNEEYIRVYIPVNHTSYVTQERLDDQLTEEQCRECLKPLEDSSIKCIMFNADFDIRVIRNQLGIYLTCWYDGYLAARLLNENEPSNKLKKLHQKYCGTKNEEEYAYDELFEGIQFNFIPLNIGYLYAANDAYITYELYEYQEKYLDAQNDYCKKKGLQDVAWVFWNIEMPCVPVVADMEDTGIAFDFEYNDTLKEKYHKLLDEKKQECYNILEEYQPQIDEYQKNHMDSKLSNPINLGSPIQLAILLYDILGTKVVDKKSPRGTGEKILAEIDLPLCKAILDYRGLYKLVGTYVDKMPDCANKRDNRIHCKFNQMGSDTGRLSSSDPNLMNIPSHNKDIRKAFKATDGYIMMSSDYSQQEVKVMAQMCGDKMMLQAFLEGKDFYAQIASLAFNKPYEECLEFRPDGTVNKEGKERRTNSKSILLGVLYGRGIDSIAEQLHTTKQKAQAIKDSVFKGFPAIPKFEQDSKEMAEELGYVTTLWGRKRRLPDLQLPDYDFKWKDGAPPDDDLLDFDDEVPTEYAVPDEICDKYWSKLQRAFGERKRKIFEEANAEGVWIIDNTQKIAQAERQCVNSRVQGSAADLTKLAMILVGTDKRLKELGFRLLIPIHDELLAECPKENAKECKERFAYLMSKAAEGKLSMPITCDVACSERWYGEEIEV